MITFVLVSSEVDFATEENTAIVKALRNSFLPRLSERESSVFATLLTDLWPCVDIELEFAGNIPLTDNQSMASSRSHKTVNEDSKQMPHARTKSQMETHRSYRGTCVYYCRVGGNK